MLISIQMKKKKSVSIVNFRWLESFVICLESEIHKNLSQQFNFYEYH